MSATVPAVERAIRILSLLADGRPEMGVSELGQELAINKSTVHGIVRTLSEYRILEQDPGTRKYRLGPGLIELGYQARSRRDLRSVAGPYLQELMQSTEETALLGVFEQDGITIIDEAQPARQLRIASADRGRLPFNAGCFGSAFLAWLPIEEVDRLIAAHGLRRFTETSITDPAEYKARLERVREQGYAIDDTQEFLEGVWAISAPIWDVSEVIAVLTMVGFLSRMTDKARRAAVKATRLAAQAISMRMGAPSATG